VQYVIQHPLVARTKFTICIYLEYFLALNNTNQIMMRMSDDAEVASSLKRQGRTDRYTLISHSMMISDDDDDDDDSAMLDAMFPIKIVEHRGERNTVGSSLIHCNTYMLQL